MTEEPDRVLSLVMTTFGGFRQATRNSEKRPWARFQGGNAGSNTVGVPLEALLGQARYHLTSRLAMGFVGAGHIVGTGRP